MKITIAIALVGLGLSVPVDAQKDGMMLGTSSNTPGDVLEDWKAKVVADVEDLADLDADIVRFPIYLNVNADLEEYWLNMASAVQEICQRERMVMVVDLHNVERVGETFSRETFVKDWESIVFWAMWKNGERRRGKIWLELANEPNNGRKVFKRWRKTALAAAKAIRRKDGGRFPIVVSPEIGTRTDHIVGMQPLPGITNQILTVHYYDWPALTNGGGGKYPFGDRNRDNMRARLQRLVGC